MPRYNRILLMGHAGNRPDKTYTTKGIRVYRFPLAVNRSKGSDADWFYITVFDRNMTKDWLEEIDKGDVVFVEGEIHINRGERKTFVDVIARRVVRLSSKSSSVEAVDGVEEEDVIDLEESLEDDDEPPY